MLVTSTIRNLPSESDFHDAFAEIQSTLRARGVTTGAWTSELNEIVLTAWTPEEILVETTQVLERSLSSRGLVGVTSILRPFPALGWGLPSSTATLEPCDLQYNPHGVPTRRAIKCPDGHVFDRNHGMSNCSVCGKILS